MNIFVLDTNPELAARFHNDRHVVKMILESCQLMAGAHWILDGQCPGNAPIQLSHREHPCATWTRRSTQNYKWLHRLTVALAIEFKSRYGHPHAYDGRIIEALTTPPRNLYRRNLNVLSTWPQCMPDVYRVPGNPVLAYRRYYYGAKQHLAHWRAPATAPAWWNEMAMDKTIKVMNV